MPINNAAFLFTLPASSGRALRCRRSCATSRLPCLAATCNGVNPFCGEKKEEVIANTHAQTLNVYLDICLYKNLGLVLLELGISLSLCIMFCSPLWPVSVKLRPPAARQRFLPGPPWLRCGEECSRWWWLHLDVPCAAAAAGLYRSFPNGTQCGGESGPPAVQ